MSEPSRPEIEKVLREAGLSVRQAKRLLSEGWRGVVGEREAEAAELRDRMVELESLLRSAAD